jgi:mono/diheme cytochrome c family protein
LFTSAKPIACAQCHANGGRAAGVGPVLAGTQRDDAYIRNQLKNGKGAMPAYPNLTEAQQNDLIAYIRSLK